LGTRRFRRPDRATDPQREQGQGREDAASLAAEREELAAELRLHTEIVAAMGEGVVLVGAADRKIVYANGTFERMFGYKPGELVGKPATVLNPSDRGPYDKAEQIPGIFEGGMWSGDVENVKKDGTPFWSHASLTSFEDPELGTIWVSVRSDITERRQQDEALAAARLELERSNEDLVQFAYMASHELIEPVRVVAGYADLMQGRYSVRLDEDGRRFLTGIQAGAKRMQTLVHDLLEFSRAGRERMPIERVDLSEILDRVLTVLEARIEEAKAQVTVGELPTVLGNDAALERVFQNLIGNAIKFADKDPPLLVVSASHEGAHWKCTVKDNGAGIPAQDLARVFELFQRGGDVGEKPGTGIGLAICLRIVERHGGRLWAESEPGRGSAFHLTLPVDRRRFERAAPGPPDSA
jgi:PAS domain S-box-containing protein